MLPLDKIDFMGDHSEVSGLFVAPFLTRSFRELYLPPLVRPKATKSLSSGIDLVFDFLFVDPNVNFCDLPCTAGGFRVGLGFLGPFPIDLLRAIDVKLLLFVVIICALPLSF
jgi:hypothetical protein